MKTTTTHANHAISTMDVLSQLENPKNECLCGCGGQTLKAKRRFLQGHDARFHSYVKRVKSGDLKASSLQQITRDAIDAVLGKVTKRKAGRPRKVSVN